MVTYWLFKKILWFWNLTGTSETVLSINLSYLAAIGRIPMPFSRFEFPQDRRVRCRVQGSSSDHRFRFVTVRQMLFNYRPRTLKSSGFHNLDLRYEDIVGFELLSLKVERMCVCITTVNLFLVGVYEFSNLDSDWLEAFFSGHARKCSK